MANDRPQPEHCDLETGVCGPLDGKQVEETPSVRTAADVLYFTDPICSHCWAMEPAWRRLLFHYGSRITVRHVYGGLLPSWDGFRDRAAGIGAPADVAPHWAEVAERYGQPIDPGVWLTDPLPSSFSPSIAVHAVRLIAPDREDAFLRRIRHAVFLEARNIARLDVLRRCAADVGVDPDEVARAFEAAEATRAFEADRASLREQDVRGFPTVLVSGPNGTLRLRGTQVFETLEAAVTSTLDIERSTRRPSAAEAVAAYGVGTVKEFSLLLGLDEMATALALEDAGAVRAGGWLWRKRGARGDGHV